MKYFVLLLLLFSLLMVDHPQINQIRANLFSMVGAFGENELQKGRVTEKMMAELQSTLASFNAKEKGYVLSRVKGAQSALDFQQSTCSSDSFNTQISSYNLNIVCGIIEKYRTDLENEIIRQN